MAGIQDHLFVLILAGGGGTRLWPLSTEKYSKQFLTLFGDRSLLQLTYSRALLLAARDKIWIATTADQVPFIKKQLPSFLSTNFSIEPVRRNTAWCQGLAATHIFKQDPEGIIINLASDHLIKNTTVFKKTMHVAALAAWDTGKLITVGIKPTFHHTGYEYIGLGDVVKKYQDITLHKVSAFVKRTDYDGIEKLLKKKIGLWNANNFVWKARSLMNEFKLLEPKIYSGLMRIYDAIGTSRENEIKTSVFQMAKSTQIDFVLTGRSRHQMAIQGAYDWTDVGDWSVVWEELPKDTAGNVIEGPRGRGKYIGINSQNNLLFLDKKIIATVGLENMLIIDTPDALLICPKDEAQGVKQVVQALKDNDLTEYL